MKTIIKKSIFAGVLIGLSACIYVSIENKIIGSMLFSIGLISVLVLDANLYTGKIGYVDNTEKFLNALVILGFNLISAFIVGLLYRLCFGINETVGTRFTDYIWYVVLLKGIGTGALIYLAVELFKKTNNIIPVILCIMAFILSGMYHCIADATYFALSNFSLSAIPYFLLVIIGNSIGSLLIRFLQIEIIKPKLVS